MAPISIDQKLKELQIVLPEIVPAGNYVPAVRTGNLLFVSGQLPKVEGKIAYKGRVGKDLNIETARRAAKACVVNLIAVLKNELGALEKVKKIVRVMGYINTYPGFNDHVKVMDAASELLVEVFGETVGPHARAVVGVVELPLMASMEMELIAEVR
ncbi:MAG: RidA family protein [Deltaproteobacteria bacterium]|nr:MAG: RidA family protein [Deltaproteobacteria bacterium]